VNSEVIYMYVLVFKRTARAFKIDGYILGTSPFKFTVDLGD
jgi:hypothetical protein